MGWLQDIDVYIAMFIQKNMRCEFLDVVFKMFTSLGDYGSIWLLLIVLLITNRKTRSIGVYSLIAYLLCILSVDVILKYVFARPRPFSNTSLIALITWPSSYSFPSGHTAMAFTISLILYAKLDKRLGLILVITACFIAFSRMYLGVHYMSDIIGGIVVGIVISRSIIYIQKKSVLSKMYESD